ncbi:protein-disulfide reductase DsbD domain-containing protein [Profundibacter sp.]|uniref:protein-disulfide reductase DsbD domain-containing protein n=1 Tax=Profundibacter sp. TaxID=3101071 RepID=UPI003D0AC294
MCSLLLIAPALAAAQSGSVPKDVLKLTVLPGWRTTTGTHMAALKIQMKPGWKTYWRAPGDGGIPPQFDWSGSSNIRSVQFHWPRPEVTNTNGMRTIVYHNEVIVPVEFTPAKPGQPLTLMGRVDLGVCNDICVPYSTSFSATLSADMTKADPVIRAALAKQPMSAAKAGVRRATCAIEPISDGLRVTATITMPSTGANEVTVIEAPDQNIWVAEASSVRSGNTLTAITEMVPPSNAPFMLDRSKIRITVMGSKRAVDIQGCTG